MENVSWFIKTSIVILTSYALGCFCTGYYFVRWRIGKDVRDLGSGNVGARNVGRVLGMFGFIITLLGDFGKGALAIWTARYVGLESWGIAISLIAVVSGHIHPVQLGLRGGKGVATTLGALLLLDYKLILFMIMIFTFVLTLTQMFTASGLIAIATVPVVAILLAGERIYLSGITITILLVLLSHKKDILNIMKLHKEDGQENNSTS